MKTPIFFAVLVLSLLRAAAPAYAQYPILDFGQVAVGQFHDGAVHDDGSRNEGDHQSEHIERQGQDEANDPTERAYASECVSTGAFKRPPMFLAQGVINREEVSNHRHRI